MSAYEWALVFLLAWAALCVFLLVALTWYKRRGVDRYRWWSDEDDSPYERPRPRRLR